MKNLRILAILILIISSAKGQVIKEATQTPTKKTQSFFEWNIGAAYVEIDGDLGVFPGTSFLLGQTKQFKNDMVLEYEAGLAFPTVLTGKIGVGKKFGKTTTILGVRPFPFNVYVASTFAHGKRGYAIVSAEGNPVSHDYLISFLSYGVLNVGYRWNIGSARK